MSNIEQETGGAGPGFHSDHANLSLYEVDFDGLAEFAGFVGREVTTNLSPNVEEIKADHHLGRWWGADIASQLVSEARAMHSDALWRSARNMTYYIATAEAMIDAINRLLDLYEDAETRAQLTPEVLQSIISASYQRGLQAIRPQAQHGFEEAS